MTYTLYEQARYDERYGLRPCDRIINDDERREIKRWYWGIPPFVIAIILTILVLDRESIITLPIGLGFYLFTFMSGLILNWCIWGLIYGLGGFDE